MMPSDRPTVRVPRAVDPRAGDKRLANRLGLLADKIRRGLATSEETDLCRVLLGTLGEEDA